MLFLQNYNEALITKLKEIATSNSKKKVVLYDFDGCTVTITPGTSVAISFATSDPITKYGKLLLEHISKRFNLSCTLEESTNSLIASLASKSPLSEECCEHLGWLKHEIVTLPIIHACRGFPNNAGSEFCYSIRKNECIFIQNYPDKIVVTLGIVFEEPSDEVFAKVICQEFGTVKKSQSSQVIPSIGVSKEPPANMPSEEAPAGKARIYISFALFQKIVFESHEKAADAIVSFRNYLHYHIKCTKSHVHSRMNVKTEQLLAELKMKEQQ